MITCKKESVIDGPWLAMDPVRLGAVSNSLGTPDLFVLVTEDGHPLLRVDHYAASDEIHTFDDAQVWNRRLAVGAGDRLYLVGLDSPELRTVELGSYFCSFYEAPEHLLATSAERVIALDRTGHVAWISGQLGIDGVVVQSVADGAITGSGEWDPPGGWRAFNISLESGEVR